MNILSPPISPSEKSLVLSEKKTITGKLAATDIKSDRFCERYAESAQCEAAENDTAAAAHTAGLKYTDGAMGDFRHLARYIRLSIAAVKQRCRGAYRAAVYIKKRNIYKQRGKRYLEDNRKQRKRRRGETSLKRQKYRNGGLHKAKKKRRHRADF